ncbi:Regulator of chromosome condensation [Macleaya cordata]|uniref:Regulator of chromosome condensation n=1 Tax=Macleaya cordata TaxID=56857 RepID=A0A200Q2M9_MACCD|nr:Regulator of chromosome condensation [Macleaya cordata]
MMLLRLQVLLRKKPGLDVVSVVSGGCYYINNRSSSSSSSFSSSSLGGGGDGYVMSFGDGSHGALGLPSSALGVGDDAYEPIKIPGLPSHVTCIGAGHYHSLAVTALGDVWAWGRNNEAQLGRGGGSLPSRDSWNKPEKVQGLSQVRVKAVYASGVVSAAIGEDGSLWVWGKSKRGQLGLGKGVTEAYLPSRVEALAGEHIVKVSLGWGHVLALTENGKLFGWGYSADGRLGQIGVALETFTSPHILDSATSMKTRETSTSFLEAAEKLVLEQMEKENDMPIIWDPCLLQELHGVQVSDVACGLDHSLILCRNGMLLSGGSNTYGQLGRDTEDLGLLPVDISFQPLSITSGLGHSLALCQQLPSSPEAVGEVNGISIASWGWNRNSQLGRRGPENSPMLVEGLEEETPVSVSGGRAHSIALTSKGEVLAWGCGKSGRLGLGSSSDELEPALIECLQDFKVLQVVSGFDHNLVLIDSG